MRDKRRIKILMSKAGLDGHDHGVKVLTLALRDEGYEVIYTGLRQTPEAIVESAIQEGVDVIGISCLTGNHKFLCGEVIKLLKEREATEIIVILGGIIPKADIPYLKKIGVKATFGPGSRIADIARFIRENGRASQAV
ncbi:cobalamin B12-binding domain-containing protein [Chloroflexota bacterium]